MSSRTPRLAGRTWEVWPTILAGVLVVAVAVLIRPQDAPVGAVAPSPQATASMAATPEPRRTVTVRSDLPVAASRALAAMRLSDVDESLGDQGLWVVLTGDAGLVPTTLPGRDSIVRTTGSAIAAATRTSDGWLAGVIDATSGELRPGLTIDDPGDWWIQATTDPKASVLIVVGSGSVDGNAVDLGVRVVDLATGGMTQLRPEVPTLGFRSELEWSASGSTVATSDCDMDVCRVDIVKVGSTSLTSIEGISPLAIGDDVVLGVDNASDFRWLIVDQATNKRSPIEGSQIDGAFDGYETSPGVFVISGRTGSGGFAVEVVDLATRETRSVYERPTDDAYLYPLSTDPGWAMIGGRGGLIDIVAGRASLDMLDLTTGELYRDALSVQGQGS